ncbi:MAG TPA: glycosyltransferase family 4 protein [Gammaproteobacteria bacterium]|jgi:UDP-glucose:(heptosyl)LPS alpha-1,3-glucosyltransferase|nr:glycosyltransferase family 4 protein [Gammaproteobacteria bacterium]
MKLAFCLLNYFPYGGLQRDFLRIAKECVRRGHEVHVYTTRWEGNAEPDLNIHLLPVKGMSNHARARSFSDQLRKMIADGQFALVLGFNKLPHLDLYYAADVCYQDRIRSERSWLYRLMPRYRTWKQLEKAVFAAGTNTRIMLISPLQQTAYRTAYGTEAERFIMLPPGISRDRIAPADAAEKRAEKRKELGIKEGEFMLLMVGSGYETKGVDRAIAGLADLNSDILARSHLFIAGKGSAARYLQQARKLKVDDRVHILGARDDVPALLLAADLLLHPAYHENTGTVLLEALAAGLPVFTTAVCGYAHYVLDAKAGTVLAEFSQSAWNTELGNLLESPEQLQRFGSNGLEFAKAADLYSMPERAADVIELEAKHHVLS